MRRRELLTIRRCLPTDLEALEWNGHYRHDRHIIAGAYACTLQGTMAMLVAKLGSEHVGQVWIDFARTPGRALVWALRVKPRWQNAGIGSRLLAAAERTSSRRGCAGIEIEVEPGNPAQRLYERRGYVHVRTELGREATGRLAVTFFVLHKPLVARECELTCAERRA